MTQPNPSRRRRASQLAAAFAALAASLALVSWGAAASSAQSGRRSQKPVGVPAEAPKPGEPAKKPESKKPEALHSFVVMRGGDTVFGIDPVARDGVAAAFARRLGQSSAIEVTDAGRGSRQAARSRAREERKAYVVLFQLEEQAGDMSVGGADSRLLIIRTFVYAPVSGDLKYTDTIYQRPFYDSARVGGVRVPVPRRRVERYPSQHELEQAARDAADRLLSRFSIAPPPENE